MIIVNKSNTRSDKNKIINLKNANLTPRVLSKRTVKDQFGNNDTFLEIEFFCQIDVLKAKNNKKYEKIDVLLSSNDLSYYSKNAKTTAAENILQRQLIRENNNIKNGVTIGKSAANPSGNSFIGSTANNLSGVGADYDINRSNAVTTPFSQKNSLNVNQINTRVKHAGSFRIIKNLTLYSDAIKVGSINVANVKNLPTTEKIINVKRNIKSKEQGRRRKSSLFNEKTKVLQQGSLNNTGQQGNLDSVFKKTYKRMQFDDKDPASLFQDSFGKKSLTEVRKGSEKIRKNGNVSRKHDQVFKNTYRLIVQNI